MFIFSKQHGGWQVAKGSGRECEEEKNKKRDKREAIADQLTSVRNVLSDFYIKYYDLHLRGLILRKQYERLRLLDLMYTETDSANAENVLQ